MVGLCHTDISMRDNDWGVSNYPLLAGHEAVGVVTALGAAVTSPPVGARVALGWIRDSCAACRACDAGRENVCDTGFKGTYLGEAAGVWGAQGAKHNETGGFFARVQRIEARFAVQIPDAVPSEVACPFICGGGTVYEPLVNYGFPGCVVGISGIGGLGTAALKLAKAMGYGTVAISCSPQKEQYAEAAGADKFVCASDEQAMTSLRGTLDFVIDTSPVNCEISKFISCLKINGTLVKVGVPVASDQSFKSEFVPLIFQQQKIAGSIVTGSKRTREMLELIGRNIDTILDGDLWKTEPVEMAKVNEAMDNLKNRKNKGYRYVLVW